MRRGEIGIMVFGNGDPHGDLSIDDDGGDVPPEGARIMKKRILASALALVLTMSMAACGAGQPTGTDAPATGETAASETVLQTQPEQGYELETLKLAGGSDWGVPSPCLLYTSPSPRDRTRSRMPSSA